MSATLIQSLLKDDKSKVATLIAAGASACALIYYNQEIRNQIANIFMVRLFYLLFPFFSLSFSLSLWFLACEEIHLFADWTSSESNILHLSNRCDERLRERERDERWKKERAIEVLDFRRRHHRSPIETNSFFGLLFSFPRALTIGVLFSLSLSVSFSPSFYFETTLNARADRCFLVIIIIIIAFTRTYSYT